MRRILLLGALALGILSSSAGADVRRTPPRAQWLGLQPVAEAGRSFDATVRIVTSTPAEITNLRIEGAGWTVRVVDGVTKLHFDAPGKQLVRFEAKPSDPAAPLFVRFEAGGQSFEQRFDLTPASVARANTPGAVKPAGVGSDSPFRSHDPRLAARPDPAAPAREGTLRWEPGHTMNDSAEPNAVAARNIRVHGRFVYQRSDGVTVGADGVGVYIYDEDTLDDELLASVATDADGFYDITFNWDPCSIFCDSQPDIYVRFEARNTEFDVQTTGGNTYAWATGTTNDYTGTNLDFGSLQPSDEDTHPALHIVTDLTRDWRWYLSYEGYNLSSVDAIWPDGPSGAYYDDGAVEIHIGVDRQWREDSQAHEYGHHFIYTHAIGQTPDYCNGICDTGGCGHCIWCQETNHDAWNEGWPNWIAHVQTTSYAADYGLASMNTRNEENVQVCSATLDDPTITEGFIGALLQDIWDTANENDPNSPGAWVDRLSLGTNEIFDVVDFDGPTNPLNFISKFKARFPAYTEQLWETAKNNTYEVDAANPGVVTGLTSPSHSTVGDSPDPTIQYSWTRATDDWSGVDGYSIVVAASAQLPNTTVDINNVTTYTTSALAPGTYWFSIRAHDKSGRWSGSYASYGPITIRLPEPANVTYHQFAGWGGETVPRGSNDGTLGSTPNPTTLLPGNATSTYWNVGGINNGESSTSTGFTSRCYVDDVFKTGFFWGAIPAGGGFYGNNGGPFLVTGGRHTFGTRYDALDAIAETNEGDNEWAHQWIWTPLTVATNTEVTRSAPPIRDAGWGSIVDGSPIWFNADGLRFASNDAGAYWHAIWLYATNNAEDYDARLHIATSSPDTGFANNRGHSMRAAGLLDAVIVNRNTIFSPTSWDVGILNSSDGVGTYHAKHVSSSILAIDDSVNVAFAAGEMMALREFLCPVADTGYVSITAKIVSGTGPVTLLWLDKTFTTGDLLDYDGIDVANGTTIARIDTHIPASGWNGIALYRDPENGTAPVTVVLEISKTPPDFMPYQAAGWYSPFVPRPAFDGTPASVPHPDTLVGNALSTYLNFAVRNDSPTPWTGMQAQAFVDDALNVTITYGAFPGNANSLFNWNFARTVRGGRHTLAVRYDYNELIEEKYEDNNIFGQQFVWSPLVVPIGTTTSRSAPPDEVAGWDDITDSPYGIWFDCDGVRLPKITPVGLNGYFGALAVMPGAASNVDLRMHELQPGTDLGFRTNLGVSAWGTGQSDFTIASFHASAFRALDAGVLRAATGGTENYSVEAVSSTFRGFFPNGIYGQYTLGANHMLHLHDWYISAGTYAINVLNASGTVDWGLSVYDGSIATRTKSGTLTNAAAWFAGPGANEDLVVTIPATGYYAIAVWKVGAADLPLSGNYSLQIVPYVLDAPGGAPTRTALAGVWPNPFRPMATIAYELASERRVRIEIFDVHGARVRTVLDETRPAGRHQTMWNGADEHGRAARPGVYFVRFDGGRESSIRRLVKVE